MSALQLRGAAGLAELGCYSAVHVALCPAMLNDGGGTLLRSQLFGLGTEPAGCWKGFIQLLLTCGWFWNLCRRGSVHLSCLGSQSLKY